MSFTTCWVHQTLQVEFKLLRRAHAAHSYCSKRAGLISLVPVRTSPCHSNIVTPSVVVAISSCDMAEAKHQITFSLEQQDPAKSALEEEREKHRLRFACCSSSLLIHRDLRNDTALTPGCSTLLQPLWQPRTVLVVQQSELLTVLVLACCALQPWPSLHCDVGPRTLPAGRNDLVQTTKIQLNFQSLPQKPERSDFEERALQRA